MRCMRMGHSAYRNFACNMIRCACSTKGKRRDGAHAPEAKIMLVMSSVLAGIRSPPPSCCMQAACKAHAMKGDAGMAQELAAKEVAAMLGITPKAFRRFVRSQAKTDAAIIGACGQGNRYGITQAEARKLV